MKTIENNKFVRMKAQNKLFLLNFKFTEGYGDKTFEDILKDLISKGFETVHSPLSEFGIVLLKHSTLTNLEGYTEIIPSHSSAQIIYYEK